MKKDLSQAQRIVVSVLYIIIILLIYAILSGNILELLNQRESTSVWFFSGILLVIMGMYVTEPFFTSPADTLSNSVSLLIILLAVVNKQKMFGYNYLVIYSVAMLLLSIVHIIINYFFKMFYFSL